MVQVLQDLLQLGQNRIHINKMPSHQAQVIGSPAFTIYTIQGTGFKRDDINSQGYSQPPGGNRSENKGISFQFFS